MLGLDLDFVFSLAFFPLRLRCDLKLRLATDDGNDIAFVHVNAQSPALASRDGHVESLELSRLGGAEGSGDERRQLLDQCRVILLRHTIPLQHIAAHRQHLCQGAQGVAQAPARVQSFTNEHLMSCVSAIIVRRGEGREGRRATQPRRADHAAVGIPVWNASQRPNRRTAKQKARKHLVSGIICALCFASAGHLGGTRTPRRGNQSTKMLAAVRRGVASRLAAPKRALSTAVSVPAVTLRYFDSRGRAQALRYALVDAGIAFEDERVSLEEISSGKWASMKSNPALTGPWGTLPVLDWGDLRIGQTEAIAAHLFRELSDDAADAAQASRRAAQCAELTSLAHQDILVMCLQLINITATMQAQFAHSQQQQGSLATAASSEAAKAQLDANIANSVMQCKGRVLGVLPRLEMLLATNGAASAGFSFPVLPLLSCLPCPRPRLRLRRLLACLWLGARSGGFLPAGVGCLVLW